MTSIIKALTAAKDLVKKLGNEAANPDASRVKNNVEGIVKDLNDTKKCGGLVAGMQLEGWCAAV